MKKVLIYDWPTRIFHGLFALSFVAAFLITKVVDDESANYAYHMILGIFMVSLVILRIIWGIIGSKYARFSSFDLSPTHLFKYFKDILQNKSERKLSHNAASSWAAIVMMALSFGLLFSGYQMVQKYNKETFEEVHEAFANIFLVIAIFHVVGIVLHTLRHKDPIGLSMVTGNKLAKTNEEENKGIPHSYIGAGVVFLVLSLFSLTTLYKNYNSTTGAFHLFNKDFNLVKIENEKENGQGGEREHEKEDDD